MVGCCDSLATALSGNTRIPILFGNLQMKHGFREVSVGLTRGIRMKRYLLAAVATAAIATPAVARDGQGYVGVEAGVAWVKSQSGDVDITYTPLDVRVMLASRLVSPG